MSNRATAQGQGSPGPPVANPADPSTSAELADIEEEADGYSMTIRARARVGHGPPQTPGPQLPCVGYNQIPQLMPQTPSRRSGNSSQSTSPSKAVRKQSTSNKTSVVSETASAPKLLKAETRGHLEQMTPPVTFHTPDCLKETNVPAPVLEFWLKYIVPAINATEVVPQEQSVNIKPSDFISPAEPSVGAF